MHEVWEESFDWKICETAEFAYQKLIYMHNNPCGGKWKLVEDITKYEHSSARYYITGKHAGYIVADIEAIFSERNVADELFKNKVEDRIVDEKGQIFS